MNNLLEFLEEDERKHLSLVLMFLQKEESSRNSIQLKFENRKFYHNEQATVGYQYHKFVSRIFNVNEEE